MFFSRILRTGFGHAYFPSFENESPPEKSSYVKPFLWKRFQSTTRHESCLRVLLRVKLHWCFYFLRHYKILASISATPDYLKNPRYINRLTVKRMTLQSPKSQACLDRAMKTSMGQSILRENGVNDLTTPWFSSPGVNSSPTRGGGPHYTYVRPDPIYSRL